VKVILRRTRPHTLHSLPLPSRPRPPLGGFRQPSQSERGHDDRFNIDSAREINLLEGVLSLRSRVRTRYLLYLDVFDHLS
jgi:hypothetical protein